MGPVQKRWPKGYEGRAPRGEAILQDLRFAMTVLHFSQSNNRSRPVVIERRLLIETCLTSHPSTRPSSSQTPVSSAEVSLQRESVHGGDQNVPIRPIAIVIESSSRRPRSLSTASIQGNVGRPTFPAGRPLGLAPAADPLRSSSRSRPSRRSRRPSRLARWPIAVRQRPASLPSHAGPVARRRPVC